MVDGGDEGIAPAEPLAVLLTDLEIGLDEPLGGHTAQTDDDFGLNEVDLLLQPGEAGVLLGVQRITVLGRTALDDVGNVEVALPGEADEGEKGAFYIGNIYTGIDDGRRTALMELFDSEDHAGDSCSTCRYNRICDGGCVANNYLLTGSLNKVPEVYCWWRRVVLDEAIRVMQTLGNEGNARFRGRWAAIR